MFEETGIHVELLGERIPRNTNFIRPLAIQKDVSDHVHVNFIYLAVPLENQTEVINYFDDLKVWCNKIEKMFNDNAKTYHTELKSR